MIVEKPFGKDSESFAQLERELSNFLTEDQMYRIDHYLGKELIENLTVGSPSGHHAWPLTIGRLSGIECTVSSLTVFLMPAQLSYARIIKPAVLL